MRYVLRFLACLPMAVILLLMCCAPLAAQSSDDDSDDPTTPFEDWMDQAKNALRKSAKKFRIKPGERFSLTLYTCVGDRLLGVIFYVTGNQSGSAYIDEISRHDAGECDPSQDEVGQALGSPQGMKRVDDVVGGLLTPDAPADTGKTARDAPATSFYLRPSFRDIPFSPVYQDTGPGRPACNVANRATFLEVNHSSDTVTLFNGCSGTVIKTMPVFQRPLQVAVTPDSSLALVTSFDGAVTFIDLTTNLDVFTLLTPDVNPSGIAISPDGKTAYLTSFSDTNPSLVTVDIASHRITNSLKMGSMYPQSVFISPDGAYAYVMCPLRNAVYIVDLFSNTVSRQLFLNRPFAVAFNATGSKAYITNGLQGGSPGNVTVYDTNSFAVLKTIVVGSGPVDIEITPDDTLMYVVNFDARSVSLVDPVTYEVLGTFPIDGNPRGIALIQ